MAVKKYLIFLMLKCTRNLFLKHNIEIPVKVADKYELWKQDAHMNPQVQQTMKVKLATQVLSHTVAAFTYELIGQSKLYLKIQIQNIT